MIALCYISLIINKLAIYLSRSIYLSIYLSKTTGNCFDGLIIALDVSLAYTLMGEVQNTVLSRGTQNSLVGISTQHNILLASVLKQ